LRDAEGETRLRIACIHGVRIYRMREDEALC
jgi:hypothetical protein